MKEHTLNTECEACREAQLHQALTAVQLLTERRQHGWDENDEVSPRSPQQVVMLNNFMSADDLTIQQIDVTKSSMKEYEQHLAEGNHEQAAELMRRYFLRRAEEDEAHSEDSYMEELEESKLGETRVVHIDESTSQQSQLYLVQPKAAPLSSVSSAQELRSPVLRGLQPAVS